MFVVHRRRLLGFTFDKHMKHAEMRQIELEQIQFQSHQVTPPVGRKTYLKPRNGLVGVAVHDLVLFDK